MEYLMGAEYDEKKCKAYKKLDAAERAAEKRNAAVFNEKGEVIADYRKTETALTDDVPEGALEEMEDGTIPVYDEKGNKIGNVTRGQAKKAEDSMTETVDGVEAIRINGKIRRVFDGSIRIRTVPSWDNKAVKGATTFDQKKVTHLLKVDGKPMYRTLDGYYISGDPELVEYMEE